MIRITGEEYNSKADSECCKKNPHKPSIIKKIVLTGAVSLGVVLGASYLTHEGYFGKTAQHWFKTVEHEYFGIPGGKPEHNHELSPLEKRVFEDKK